MSTRKGAEVDDRQVARSEVHPEERQTPRADEPKHSPRGRTEGLSPGPEEEGRAEHHRLHEERQGHRRERGGRPPELPLEGQTRRPERQNRDEQTENDEPLVGEDQEHRGDEGEPQPADVVRVPEADGAPDQRQHQPQRERLGQANHLGDLVEGEARGGEEQGDRERHQPPTTGEVERDPEHREGQRAVDHHVQPEVERIVTAEEADHHVLEHEVDRTVLVRDGAQHRQLEHAALLLEVVEERDVVADHRLEVEERAPPDAEADQPDRAQERERALARRSGDRHGDGSVGLAHPGCPCLALHTTVYPRQSSGDPSRRASER